MNLENKKLNILFLTARFPYPLVGGDRVKPHYTLKYLSKFHNVTLVSFHQGKDIPDEHRKVIVNMGIDVHIIKLNPLKAATNIVFKHLFSLPLEIAYYYQPEFKNTVEELFNKKFRFSVAFYEDSRIYKNKKYSKSIDC